MTPNPYAPPRRHEEPPGAPSRTRLFGVVLIVVSIVAFPPIGAAMAAENYRRLGDTRGLWRALALFLIPSCALLVLTAMGHNRGQIILFWLAKLALAWGIGRDQRPLLRRHVAAGGRRVRWYLGLLWTIPLCILGLAIWQFLQPSTYAVPH